MTHLYRRTADNRVQAYSGILDNQTMQTLGLVYVGPKKELEAQHIARRMFAELVAEIKKQDEEWAIMNKPMFKQAVQDCRLGRIPAHSNDDVYMDGFEMQSSYEHCLSQIGFRL